jgi:MoaA/NifB/PqqE/SkfB family radical SAM enzyme/dephospho-CoA kinase
MIIGVTGNIGCGKTFLCMELIKLSNQQNIPITYIDIDTLRREMLSKNLDYLLLRNRICSKLNLRQNIDSSISIYRLNKKIYSDKNAMIEFKKLLYDEISNYINLRLKNSPKIILLEWALLIDDNLFNWLEGNIILVTCKKQEQINRLKLGDLSILEINKRISLQSSILSKQKKALQNNFELLKIDMTKNLSPNHYLKILTTIQDYFSSESKKYLSCVFRIPNNGGRVLWELTNSCNYCCKYCIFSSERMKIPNELSTNEVFRSLLELKSQGFTQIKFTGGEPFLRKDLFQILKKASDFGFGFDLSTNASLITNEIANNLRKLNIKMIHVSLDGHKKAIQEMIRGKFTFEPTIRGIKILTNQKIYTRVGCVVFKGNQSYLEQIVQFVANLGVNEIIFSLMEPVGRMKGDNSQICDFPRDYLRNHLNLLKEKYSQKIIVSYSISESLFRRSCGECPAVKKMLYINNFGNIAPCTWIFEVDPSSMSKLSLKNHSLKQILNSKPLKKYLTSHILGCPAREKNI